MIANDSGNDEVTRVCEMKKKQTRLVRLMSALYLRLKKRKIFKIVKGAFGLLLKPSFLQNIKKSEGRFLWRQKKFEKSRKMPEKINGGTLQSRPVWYLTLKMA